MIGSGVLKIPPIEGLVKLFLVMPENGDINILVGSRLASHPEVKHPASHNPPGRVEAGHEARKPGRNEVLPLPMVGVVQADHGGH